MRPELALVALFSVATAVAIAARRLRLPYTVALVLAGLFLGSAHVFEPPRLTKDLLYAVFLPGLLFEAAFALEFRKFWANKLAVSALAVPGLLAAIALTDVFLVPSANALSEPHFGFLHGLVFASVIAATDPIAVVGLFKTLGAPKRLAVLVEGESLLNDGTAVVVFTIVLGVATGKPFSMASASVDFARVVGMGLVIGAALGYAVSLVIQRVDDAMIEITLTTIAGYGSFVAAEHFHFSGVIATVTAGLICGNYAATTGMSATTRVSVATFWEYLAFALNSLVFLLIGFEVRVEALAAAWKPILLGYVAVTAGRAVVIVLVSLLLSRTKERFPLSWSAVLTWGGLRGGLSMVLVLGLPAGLEHRDLLISMTFGVVILSILVQGLTMGPLLRWLGLVGKKQGEGEYERLRGAQQGLLAALGELEAVKREGATSDEALDPVRAQYESRLEQVRADLKSLRMGKEDLREEESRAAQRRALIAEKDAIQAAHRGGQLGAAAYEELLGDVDARLLELE